MNKQRMTEKVVAAALVAAVAGWVAMAAPPKVAAPVVPAKPAAAPGVPAGAEGAPAVIDLKQVEGKLLAAQAKLAAGELEAGLAIVREAQPQAVTAELAARVNFLQRLAEVLAVNHLGDPAKVLVALQGAFKAATLPDQTAAVWQVGQAAAQAATKVRNDGGAQLVDFLATGPGPAIHQPIVHLQLAQLRLALGNTAAAGDELRKANPVTRAEWIQWVTLVGQVAAVADAGQFPKAGMEAFENFREAANSSQGKVLIDLAEGQFLLRRGRLDVAEATGLLDRAGKIATGDDRAALVALAFDFAVAFQKAGKAEAAGTLMAKAETLAEPMAALPAVVKARAQAQLALGKADLAAATASKGAQAAKAGPARDELLVISATALAAQGKGAEVVKDLAGAKAGASVYTALAGSLARAGKPADALAVLGAIPADVLTQSPTVVAEITVLMQQIQQGRQQVAQQQATQCKALAAVFEAQAKTVAAKDAKAADALVKQAAALKAVAAQMEK